MRSRIRIRNKVKRRGSASKLKGGSRSASNLRGDPDPQSKLKGIRIHIIMFGIRHTAFDSILLKIKIHPIHLKKAPYGIVNVLLK
jgi:hypothetical protein